MMSTKYSAKEIATRFDTDARTLRKFLRQTNRAAGVETPGKGSRWEIEAKQVASLKRKFIAWNEAKATTPAVEDEATESTDEVIDA